MSTPRAISTTSQSLVGEPARGDCVEEAETKVSSDEAELRDAERLADTWRRSKSVPVALVSDFVADLLAGGWGGSRRGVFMIRLGRGETSSVAEYGSLVESGGVDGRPSTSFLGGDCAVGLPSPPLFVVMLGLGL